MAKIAPVMSGEDVFASPSEAVKVGDENLNDFEEGGGKGAASASAAEKSAVAGKAVSDYVTDWAIEENYQKHLESVRLIDKTFMFRGMSSMRMVFLVMCFGAPVIYMHPWLFLYSMLEVAWFPTMLWRLCASCEGNVAFFIWINIRASIGRDVERIHYGYEWAIIVIYNALTCCYNVLFIDDPSEPTEKRYGNASWFSPTQLLVAIAYFRWRVKGKTQLKIVSTKRIFDNTLWTMVGFLGCMMALSATLIVYNPGWNWVSENVSDGIFAKFVYDLIMLSSVTGFTVPLIFKISSHFMFGPLNPAFRQDRLRKDGAWGTEQWCSWLGNMVYMQQYAMRSAMAIFWAVSALIFASPLALTVNRTKDLVFLVAHFNIKFSWEFMSLAIQRSPLRGPAFFRRMMDGEMKNWAMGSDKQDYFRVEEYEAILEYERFIYVNDVDEDRLDVYAKLPERGRELKKFMQYAVEFIPVNLRCMLAENIPYPWTEHLGDTDFEIQRLEMSRSSDNEAVKKEAQAHDWLVGQEFLVSASGNRMMDLPNDLNRCFVPMGICVAKAYNLPALRDTDSLGAQHYMANQERVREMLLSDLAGAVPLFVDRPEEERQWRTYSGFATALEGPAPPVPSGLEKEDEEAAAKKIMERDTMGNPQSYAGFMSNWYAGVGPEFNNAEKRRLEKDLILLGLVDRDSADPIAEVSQNTAEDIHREAKFREMMRLKRRENPLFTPANWWLGPSPFAEDYEVSNASRMGTLSPYHAAALMPIVLRFQWRNLVMCHIRWTTRLCSLLILMISLSFTRWQIMYVVETYQLQPQMYVPGFLYASSLGWDRWALIWLFFVLDLLESFFTERNRWLERGGAIGGRKRCLPLMDQMCMHEVGLHEFRWWRIVRWYLVTSTASTVPIHVVITVVAQAKPHNTASTRWFPGQKEGAGMFTISSFGG